MRPGTARFASDCHGWAELLPPLHADRRVAWVVVGAGLTGLAAARRLAGLYPDDEILLLEARRVAEGASGRNSGFVVATSQFPGGFVEAEIDNYRRVNRINRAGLELLATQIAQQRIDCQWRREGFYHTAADHAALVEYRHFLDYLERLEVEHRILDGEQLHALLGTRLYRAGVHIADGALVQPAALVRGLAETLPTNVSLYERSPVLEIVRGKPLKLRLDNAVISTDRRWGALSVSAALRPRRPSKRLRATSPRSLCRDREALHTRSRGR